MIYIQVDTENHNLVIGKFNCPQKSLSNMYEIDGSRLLNYSMPCYDPDSDTITEHPSVREVLERQYLEKIKAETDEQAAQLIWDYPEIETKTWMQQREEAYAYMANSSANTPLIDALATERGMDKAELVTRIIQKAEAWSITAGQIVGKRQAKEDAMKDMTDDELRAYLAAN